ncbi:hypothetical protein HWC36_gp51 [Corynebacterium phage StAB]|uniref:Uncharacterized protein n=1 Tax=Corynebacterium phage StAB TaxID=2591204 RepID=A0A514DJK7_9CAUD|nr:hypothetical protein HWC36_gp51 [Corynebacterium phage StAB]QDH93762.1 hypothetical protein SEA_STAB_51 [Corynebacterium phage StAB]
MTIKNYLSEAYIEGRLPGDRSSREDAYQTMALCVIADTLQILASHVIQGLVDHPETPEIVAQALADAGMLAPEPVRSNLAAYARLHGLIADARRSGRKTLRVEALLDAIHEGETE